MTINLISDIHCRNKSLPPNLHFEQLAPADVLVIAGDLGTYPARNKILDNIKKNYTGENYQFKHLVYCWGNHDYYVTDRWWLKKHFDIYQGPNTSDNHVDVIDDVAFICSTMWSFIYDHSKITAGMNDYVYIPTLTSYQSTELFEKNAKWILDMIELYKGMNKKTVVVTHHLPHPQTISEEYRRGPNSELNEAFCVLKQSWYDAFEKAGADLWLHGHSHQFDDQVIGTTRCVRNPFGYDWAGIQEWQYTGFKYNCILEI